MRFWSSRRLVFGFLAAGIVGLVVAGAEAQVPAQHAPAATGPARGHGAAGGGLVVQGEHFTVRKIVDHEQRNLLVELFLAPQTWTDRSEVRWDYGSVDNPVGLSLRVENPTNEEAMFAYPSACFFALPGPSALLREGQSYGGMTMARPMPPFQALSAYVRRARGGLPGFRILGQRDMPDLPALRLTNASQHPRGIAMKVSYELHGKPVEEAFYAVHYQEVICASTPGGRACQTNWGLFSPHSFRAPAGTLERRLAVFAVITKSFRPNPAWQRRVGAVRSALNAEFQRALQAGYDQTAAAKRAADQISRGSDAFLANVERQERSSRASRGGGETASTDSGGASGSAVDRADDYLRGVVTVDDPLYGTSQQSDSAQYHFTDGYGSYRHSNDVTYDPNKTETGDWQLMAPGQ